MPKPYPPEHQDWTRTQAGREELLGYLEGVADKYGVRPNIRFGDKVTLVTWHDDSREY